jgi:hypothetical protein
MLFTYRFQNKVGTLRHIPYLLRKLINKTEVNNSLITGTLFGSGNTFALNMKKVKQKIRAFISSKNRKKSI